MIIVLDYGVGNLFSIRSALSFLNIPSEITSDPEKVKIADKIILPGVGAFESAKKKLIKSGMEEALRERVKNGVPLLGICLGMQLLFEKSYEYGEHKGLGFLPGEVVPILNDAKKVTNENIKVPQMGWNSLEFYNPSPLLKYINDGDHVYYVHSYYAKNVGNCLVASSKYFIDITGISQLDNIFGTQFHPEKSGKTGLKILTAFAEI